jgi:DNA-directed RNA polymerase specialized sigma24 family protein
MFAQDSENRDPQAAVSQSRPLIEPSSANAFQSLLSRLRQEGGSAEERYESLRGRLIVFFRLYVPAEAEALTDRTLDRVARKLVEGTEIENLLPFTLGVSRMILVECNSQRSRELRAQEGYAAMIEPPATPPDIGQFDEEETRLRERVHALRECLAELGDRATYLILTYYDSDGSERISRRQRLAAELGLSLNALRNRALRLRDMLERSLASSTFSGRD